MLDRPPPIKLNKKGGGRVKAYIQYRQKRTERTRKQFDLSLFNGTQRELKDFFQLA